VVPKRDEVANSPTRPRCEDGCEPVRQLHRTGAQNGSDLRLRRELASELAESLLPFGNARRLDDDLRRMELTDPDAKTRPPRTSKTVGTASRR